MLEEMAAFFNARADGYEEHQLECIAGAKEFYPYTAGLLPKGEDVMVLDLGCGTGLELNEYFKLNPQARVTGIDLSEGMLRTLAGKFPKQDIALICDSFFTVPLGRGWYDAAVAVESLHHFTAEEKRALYRKVYDALKPEGYFILTDYVAPSEAEAQSCRAELARQKAAENIPEDVLCHFDIPLTAEHELETLRQAGFTAEILRRWESTVTIRAKK